MNLEDRDYEVITNDAEHDAYIKECAFLATPGIKSNKKSLRFTHPNEDIKKFLWHKCSLFPNNYLYFKEYGDINFEEEALAFNKVIYDSDNELEIQQYIKNNKKWFIPGSIFLDYNFGHHDAYLFPEQMLGSEYVADYMLLGKNSDGYNIVLIEFEKANTEYLLNTSNSESKSVRDGLTQIQDWKRWIDNNRNYFLQSLNLTAKGIDIPIYRIYYYLVVSRRDFMTPKAIDVRAQTIYERNNLKIVTFDRLVDNVLKLSMRRGW